MSGKAIYKQKDIVLTKFPFSNLTDFKVRPVLVLSKNSYNRKYADVIVCAITSNLEESDYGLTINHRKPGRRASENGQQGQG